MIVLAEVSAEPLDAAAHVDMVADAAAGATALFVGTVRDHDPEAVGRVVELEYRGHPDSERILRAIAERHDHTDIRIALSHRIGTVRVGGTAIVCAVSSAHRADAFAICREIVERVKAELPMWKKQIEADGAAHWVGLGALAS